MRDHFYADGTPYQDVLRYRDRTEVKPTVVPIPTPPRRRPGQVESWRNGSTFILDVGGCRAVNSTWCRRCVHRDPTPAQSTCESCGQMLGSFVDKITRSYRVSWLQALEEHMTVELL